MWLSILFRIFKSACSAKIRPTRSNLGTSLYNFSKSALDIKSSEELSITCAVCLDKLFVIKLFESVYPSPSKKNPPVISSPLLIIKYLINPVSMK